MLKRAIIGASLALLVIIEMSACYPTADTAVSQERDIEPERVEISESNAGNPEEPSDPEERKENQEEEGATDKETDLIENPPNSANDGRGQDYVEEKEVDEEKLHEVSEVSEFRGPTNDRHVEGFQASIRDVIKGDESVQPEEDLATQPQPPQGYTYKAPEEDPRRQYQNTFPSMNCPPHVRCTHAPKGVQCTEFQANLRAPTTTNELAHSDCCPIHSCRREDGSKFYHFGIEVEEAGNIPRPLSSPYMERFGPGSSAFSSYSSASSSQQNVPPAYYSRSRISSALYLPQNERQFSQASSQNAFGQGPYFRFQSNNAPGGNNGEVLPKQQPNNNFFQSGPAPSDAFGPVENSENNPEIPVDRLARTANAERTSFSGEVGSQQSPYEYSSFNDWSRTKRMADADGRAAAGSMNSNFKQDRDQELTTTEATATTQVFDY